MGAATVERKCWKHPIFGSSVKQGAGSKTCHKATVRELTDSGFNTEQALKVVLAALASHEKAQYFDFSADVDLDVWPLCDWFGVSHS